MDRSTSYILDSVYKDKMNFDEDEKYELAKNFGSIPFSYAMKIKYKETIDMIMYKDKPAATITYDPLTKFNHVLIESSEFKLFNPNIYTDNSCKKLLKSGVNTNSLMRKIIHQIEKLAVPDEIYDKYPKIDFDKCSIHYTVGNFVFYIMDVSNTHKNKTWEDDRYIMFLPIRVEIKERNWED